MEERVPSKLFCVEINSNKSALLRQDLCPVYVNIKFIAPPGGHKTMFLFAAFLGIAYVQQDRFCQKSTITELNTNISKYKWQSKS